MGFLLNDAESGDGVVICEVIDASAAAIAGLAVGSLVISVNEVDVLGWSKTPVVHLLGKSRRPLTLHVAGAPPPEPSLLTYTFGAGCWTNCSNRIHHERMSLAMPRMRTFTSSSYSEMAPSLLGYDVCSQVDRTLAGRDGRLDRGH